MFGVMYDTEDGKVFKVVQTLTAAHDMADALALKGYSVTVFCYDASSDEYYDFFIV